VKQTDSSIEQTRDVANNFSQLDGGAPLLASTYEHNLLSIRFNLTHDTANVHRFLLHENRLYDIYSWRRT